MMSFFLKILEFFLLFHTISAQKLAVVITDGLAANTFYKFSHLPVFRTFEEEGVWSAKVFPVFPTFSISNRHSLMTGVLPRRHGLIGDHVYNWRDDVKFQNFTADSDFSRQCIQKWTALKDRLDDTENGAILAMQPN
uniref:glycerophosphocholine cholinephosphodiesterase n=1 Tax=Caenorhabditis japonica TaxID=281687 RepID=A0A8R1DE90_CAEJA